MMAEPNPGIPPLRAFADGRPPVAESLGEVRTIMDGLTAELVDILTQRCDLAIGAVIFKQNLDEVQAPEQQARNISRAVDVAKEIWPDSPAFHTLVENVMKVIVPSCVAMQAEAFEHTTPITDLLLTEQSDV
jgi:chorismate mutase